MKLLIAHLVDSRDLYKAEKYISEVRNEDGIKQYHLFLLCGNPDLEYNDGFNTIQRVPGCVFVSKGSCISRWVDEIFWHIAHKHIDFDFDFLQIRDWDDEYEISTGALGEFLKSDVDFSRIGIIAPNYKVKYIPEENEVPNPYGTFENKVYSNELPDPRICPILIHRQFKFVSKSVISFMFNKINFPSIKMCDDILFMHSMLLSCYVQGLEVHCGMDSNMTLRVFPKSTNQGIVNTYRGYGFVTACIETYTYILHCFKEYIQSDLNLSEFILKSFIDRGQKHLFSLGYHKVNG